MKDTDLNGKMAYPVVARTVYSTLPFKLHHKVYIQPTLFKTDTFGTGPDCPSVLDRCPAYRVKVTR